MRHLPAFLLLAVSCLASPSDWPRFLGPDGSGISRETGINRSWNRRPPKLVWSVRLGDNGYAGPAVAQRVVFIVDHEGSRDIVRALDLATGVERWRFAYEESATDVFGFARSTPAVFKGKVYTLSRLGKLQCLDARSGKPIWSRDIVTDFGGQRPKWDIASSPVFDRDTLLVCPGGVDAAVVGLDPDTGSTRWRGGGSGVTGYNSPVVATIGGKRQVVMFLFSLVEGIDDVTGNVLWTFPWSDWSGVSACAPIVSGDSVFITSGYARGSALLSIGPTGPTPLWDRKALESEFSTPVLIGGHLYGTSAPGNLVCVEWATGKQLWKQPGFEKGGLIAVGRTLIVMNGSNGDLTLVEASPSGYHELGRLGGLGGQSWTAPILADGMLLVRNKKTLACYDLR